MPPAVSKVSLSLSADTRVLTIEGKNLHIDNNFPPVAVVNDKLAKILSSDANQLRIEVDPTSMRQGKNSLVMTLDPYAVFKIDLKN